MYNFDLMKYVSKWAVGFGLYTLYDGLVEGINKSADDYIQRIINEIKKLFTFDTSGLKTYAGLFILFLIAYKKI